MFVLGDSRRLIDRRLYQSSNSRAWSSFKFPSSLSRRRAGLPAMPLVAQAPGQRDMARFSRPREGLLDGLFGRVHRSRNAPDLRCFAACVPVVALLCLLTCGVEPDRCIRPRGRRGGSRSAILSRNRFASRSPASLPCLAATVFGCSRYQTRRMPQPQSVASFSTMAARFWTRLNSPATYCSRQTSTRFGLVCLASSFSFAARRVRPSSSRRLSSISVSSCTV